MWLSTKIGGLLNIPYSKAGAWSLAMRCMRPQARYLQDPSGTPDESEFSRDRILSETSDFCSLGRLPGLSRSF